jgi:hypothetical protein
MGGVPFKGKPVANISDLLDACCGTGKHDMPA